MTVEVHSPVTGNGAGSPPASGLPASPPATNGRIGRRSYPRIPTVLEAPHLVQIQLDSFREFKEEGLEELFTEISPIQDYNQKSMDLSFEQVEFDEPRATVELCRERDMTYAAPLYVKARLLVKETGEIKESRVYLGEFPMMTEDGTFIINGAERVVVSQLVRSPGVYFTAAEDPSSGRKLFAAKLIPNRGAWLEFETSNKDVLSVKVDRKRKMPVTILLRAFGYGSNEEIKDLFKSVDTDPEHVYIQSTLDRDTSASTNDGLVEVYKRLRP